MIRRGACIKFGVAVYSQKIKKVAFATIQILFQSEEENKI